MVNDIRSIINAKVNFLYTQTFFQNLLTTYSQKGNEVGIDI